jgi:hypothetical protein
LYENFGTLIFKQNYCISIQAATQNNLTNSLLHKFKNADPALGVKFNDHKIGTFGDVGFFSFQRAKLAVSGGGGTFVTNDESLYERAKLLSSMSRTDF